MNILLVRIYFTRAFHPYLLDCFMCTAYCTCLIVWWTRRVEGTAVRHHNAARALDGIVDVSDRFIMPLKLSKTAIFFFFEELDDKDILPVGKTKCFNSFQRFYSLYSQQFRFRIDPDLGFKAWPISGHTVRELGLKRGPNLFEFCVILTPFSPFSFPGSWDLNNALNEWFNQY